MAAVIHMFCTLQEAARGLHISEEQIETMLQRGILREFREGPHRLLKAADVVLLARTLGAGRCSSSAGAGNPASVARERDVRLPRCAAVAAETRGRSLPRPRTAGQPLPGGMAGVERAAEKYGPAGRRRPMERSPAPEHRPSAPAAPLSVREWFWEGLAQDRPIAIILLFGLALLTLTAMVAGVFLAVKVL